MVIKIKRKTFLRDRIFHRIFHEAPSAISPIHKNEAQEPCPREVGSIETIMVDSTCDR
jgi:hypothetical protein